MTKTKPSLPTDTFPEAYAAFWNLLRQKEGVNRKEGSRYVGTTSDKIRYVISRVSRMSVSEFYQQSKRMRLHYKPIWEKTKRAMCESMGFDPETGEPLLIAKAQMAREAKKKPGQRQLQKIEPRPLPIYPSEEARQEALKPSNKSKPPANLETVGACLYYLLQNCTVDEKTAMLGITKGRWSMLVHSLSVPTPAFLDKSGWMKTIERYADPNVWQGPYGQKLRGYVAGTWTPDIETADRYSEITRTGKKRGRPSKKEKSGAVFTGSWAVEADMSRLEVQPGPALLERGARRVFVAKKVKDSEVDGFAAFCTQYPSLYASDPVFARKAYDKMRRQQSKFDEAGAESTWRKKAASFVRDLRTQKGLQFTEESTFEPMGDFGGDFGVSSESQITALAGFSGSEWRRLEEGDPSYTVSDYTSAVKALCDRCGVQWRGGASEAVQTPFDKRAQALIEAARPLLDENAPVCRSAHAAGLR